ncbi:hypothetical protein P389DRAFT_194609 [Cystobasidium minutum MCA 4210]|uniref:uncharacterized protein n=1 Tax=Cystobasidium minutum MCA 4210 TaxID=1397322 RepID=UPI0034CFD01C|eukprot:jgi/Rhomi1/194609/gm1.2823_g
MSASMLTASLKRSAILARAFPVSKAAARQQLPCTCQVQRRLQSTATETTRVGEAAAAASTSSASSSLRNSTTSPTTMNSSSARVAQESFRRQQSRARSLPVIKDQKKLYLGVAACAITAWTFFVLWAMSAEKAASTVVRTLLFNLRTSPLVTEMLGEGVRPKPFLFGGEPWVHGTVNTIQGVVDIHFRVISDSGREGTVYFKSIRRTKGARFETQDFKLVIDGNPKQTVELSSTDLLGLHKV